MSKVDTYEPKEGYAWNPLLRWPQNEQCFCDSEKKFKKCCRDKLPRAVPMSDAVEIYIIMKARGMI